MRYILRLWTSRLWRSWLLIRKVWGLSFLPLG